MTGELLKGGATVLLKLADESQVLFDAALDAVLVEGEALELFAGTKPETGGMEGGIDFSVVGEDIVGLVETAGEDVGFDSGSALEAPAVVGDGLNEVGLQRADGDEGLVNALAMLLVGHFVVGLDDEDMACQAMPVSVESAAIARLGSRMEINEHLAAFKMIGP